MVAYKSVCDQMDATKPWLCWFCGSVVTERSELDHHHTVGRDGDLLLSREYLVHAHRDCHRIYHDYSLDGLLKTKWYIDWLKRVGVDDRFRSVYRKEMDKFSKNNLTPTTYDNELRSL